MLNFLGIGAQKSGTTWLYEMLNKHPNINFPLNKEAHYWNSQYPSKPPESYLKNFHLTNKTEGEITPAYAMLNKSTIQTIYSKQPNLTIFFIHRDPIDRAWSSAKMALKKSEMTIEEASDQWFIDHFNSRGSLNRGNYQHCLENWSDVFPNNQICIIDYGLIKKSPVTLLNHCCNKLDIRPFTEKELQSIDIHRRVFQGIQHELRPTLAPILNNLYQERTQLFKDYLEREFPFRIL